VINVSSDDAQSFIAWLNSRTGRHYRLPTEDEWEFVARAGATTAYSWGDDPNAGCAHANGSDQSLHREFSDWPDAYIVQCDDGHFRTAPVGSYRSNPYGVHDIHGNVWEWVDCCSADRRRARGGSWYNVWRVLDSALKNDEPATFRDNRTGFRLARTL
jgi:formylglycine-generating enzyme required for sulfatase activity